jgi:hypothetical protein
MELSAKSIRDLVHRTVQELKLVDVEQLGESLLTRAGYYVGREFRFKGVRAVWIASQRQIKFYGDDGQLLRVLDGGQAEGNGAAWGDATVEACPRGWIVAPRSYPAHHPIRSLNLGEQFYIRIQAHWLDNVAEFGRFAGDHRRVIGPFSAPDTTWHSIVCQVKSFLAKTLRAAGTYFCEEGRRVGAPSDFPIGLRAA